MKEQSRHFYLRCVLSVFTVAYLLSATADAVTTINIPPSPSPATVEADTVVNVLTGGVLQANNGVIARNGGIVNVNGGQATDLTIRSGAVANVVSGGVNGRFWAEDAGQVSHQGGRTSSIFLYTGGIGEIRGGAVETIGAVPGSALTISGVDFSIDGVPVSGLTNENDSVSVNLPIGAVLTSTLADGTSFGKFQRGGQQATIIDNGVLTLRRSAVPAPAAPGTFNVTNASTLPTARAGQTVVVQPNGVLAEQFRAGPGSTVRLEGGRIEAAFHAIGSNLLINSGTMGRRLNAYDDATVTISGGQLDGDSQFYRGSTFNVQGGTVGGGIWIWDDATLNLSGGSIYEAAGFAGSVINISGGTMHTIGTEGRVNVTGGELADRVDVTNTGVIDFAGGRSGDFISVRSGGQMIVHGSDFRINGIPAQGLSQVGDAISVGLAKGVVLSGIYTDGTPFVFSGDQESVLAPIQVIQTAVPTAAPTVFHVPSDPVPNGVRQGQTLILAAGGALPANYTAGYGSTVRIEGGTLGNNFEATGAIVDIIGGSIGTLDAFAGTTMNIGGTADYSGLNLYQGASVSIHVGAHGGGNFVNVQSGTLTVDGGDLKGPIVADHAQVSISGGTLQSMQLEHYSTATIIGGKFSSGIGVLSGSTLHANGGEIANITTSVGDSDLIGIANTVAYVNGATVKTLRASEYSKIDVTRGNIGDTDCLGGQLVIRGGATGDSHEWLAGAVELDGYDFQVNGVPIAGLNNVGNSINFNYTPGTTLRGVLSDGTPFNITPNDNFAAITVTNGVLKLVRTAAASLPATVNVAGSSSPYGAAPGQTIIVEAAGSLQPNFVAGHDSVVQIQGGTVGDNFEADQSEVTISGSTVGNRLDVFNGAHVTLNGGSIGEELEVHTGGVLNIQGGAVGRLGKAVGGVVNMTGGTLATGFGALANSVVNISGGSVAGEFVADNGSTVNVSGGEIGSGFSVATGGRANISGGHMKDVRSGTSSTIAISGGNIDNFDSAASAKIDISGGAFGDNFDITATAIATFTGTQFTLDGVPVAGLDTPGGQTTFSMPTGKTFAGLLADGTPFAFRSTESDSISNLKLIRSADLSPGPSAIDVSSTSALMGVRASQTLTLHGAGSLPINFNAGSGSRVDIVGGSVANNFEANSALVNIGGGTIGAEMDAFGASTVNISGGTIGTNFDVYDQSIVNMTGGQVTRLDALAGSTVNMNGGYLTAVQQSTGSATHWRGGTIGSITTAGTTPSLYMYGASFEVNGVAVAGLVNEGDSVSQNVAGGSTITAVMSDGTPIVLGVSQITNGTLRLIRSSPPPVLSPTFQQVSAGLAPQTVGSGQTLLLNGTGQLPANFVAGPGSTLDFEGSATGSNLSAFGADLNIAGGTIATLQALKGTSLQVTGGTISSAMRLFPGASAEIFGGKLSSAFYFDANTIVDIFGKSFLLNNQPIAGLQSLGDVVVMSQRSGQTLTAILTDGSTLSWRLTLASQRDLSGISSQATLRLHVAVPEPTRVTLVAVAAVLGCCFRRRVC